MWRRHSIDDERFLDCSYLGTWDIPNPFFKFIPIGHQVIGDSQSEAFSILSVKNSLGDGELGLEASHVLGVGGGVLHSGGVSCLGPHRELGQILKELRVITDKLRKEDEAAEITNDWKNKISRCSPIGSTGSKSKRFNGLLKTMCECRKSYNSQELVKCRNKQFVWN
ncbi:unnamed protein product [Nesidiocoris tenuis]|uniref:Uncharacterized protein n=1 Tax=Nesidiocoris tenuis TaxID=355587 RepID=A0A6H5HGZ9_9HEMI|nr:unnamed protein product [Nesidiocoris tenuis]